MAEEWVGCAVGSGPTCNAGRCTLWIFGGKGYGILILIVSHLDRGWNEDRAARVPRCVCPPIPSIDTIVVFDVCTFVEIFKIWSKSIFFFFLSEKLFESFARRTKLHAENCRGNLMQFSPPIGRYSDYGSTLPNRSVRHHPPRIH